MTILLWPPELEVQFATRVERAAAAAGVTWRREDLDPTDPKAVGHAALVDPADGGDTGAALGTLAADVVARAAAAPHRTLLGLATLRRIAAGGPGGYYLLAQWRYY